ncbi:MAG TPA: prolyl aminopeptidase [Candidatus Tumulicola sp.]
MNGGWLDVGNSQKIYWERSGNPSGRPVVYLHGGPGSGCSHQRRKYFDPNVFNIVLFDQRGCGRSLPRVETLEHLKVNTTAHLVNDMEQLRAHLRIERWSILGASWGSTLALAYGQTHPSHVDSIVLACVTTTSRREVEWMTRDMGRIFPEQWERFSSLGGRKPYTGSSLPDVYADLVFCEDASTRELAAREWCAWEDTHVSLAPGFTPNPRFDDPDFRLLFTRLVTHYWRNAAFLAEDQLIRNVSELDGIPGILLHGRHDISSPVETAWRLHRQWRGSQLHILNDAGHGGGSMTKRIVEAFNSIGTPGQGSGSG